MPHFPGVNVSTPRQFLAQLDSQVLSKEQDEVELTATATRKRGRPSDAESFQPNKKRAGPSGHEKRLVGDYSNPDNAQPIQLLQPRDHSELASQGTKMTSVKPGRGAPFRPRNTLGSSPYSSKSLPQGKGLFQSQESTSRSGLNREKVSQVSSVNGDGFEDQERSIKRRKTGAAPTLQMASRTGLSSDPIDLDGEEEDGVTSAQTTAQQRNALPSASSKARNAPLVSSRPPPPLQNTERQNVDRYTDVDGDVPRKRRSRDGRSSQASSHDAPVRLTNGHHKPPMTENSVIELDGDGPPQPPRAESKRPGSKSSSRILPINLDKDPDPRRSAAHRPGSKGDVQASVNVLQSFMRPPSRATGVTETRKQQVANQSTRRTTKLDEDEDGSFNFYGKMGQQERPPTPPARKSFVRDVPDPPNEVRPKARERMKGTSEVVQTKVSPINDKEYSEDELAGGSTVGSQVSRSASPEKRHLSTTNRRPAPKAKTVRQRKLDSEQRDIQANESNISRAKKSAQVVTDQVQHEEEGVLCIPIKSIFCRACVLDKSTGALHLVLDEESGGFFVQHDGSFVKVPNKEQLAYIGKSETSQWIHAKQEKVYTVQIKGSITPNSNGSILLSFYSSEDLSNCFNYLFAATHDTLKMNTFSKAKMQGIMENQSVAILEDHKKQKSRPTQADDELAGMQHRKMTRDSQRHIDTNSIIYENGRTGRPSTMRSRMQPDGSNEAGSSSTLGTQSPYFMNGTRRSSRQAKPVKPKSPTPPPPVRWTREHKPKRWSQSIVFPPEGKNRVTVDFTDLERLDEGEFLNDNVISYALRRVQENMAPEHKDNVHFFNTFFYTSLTTKNGKKAFNYDAVKRWTKSNDIFNFPYIVVPINIDFHWFVAIICNLPSLSRKSSALENDADDASEEQSIGQAGQEVEVSVQHDDHDVDDSNGQNNENPVTNGDQELRPAMKRLSLSEDEKGNTVYDTGEEGTVKQEKYIEPNDEVPDASSSRPNSASRKKGKKAPPPPKKYDPDSPSIITLDSFGSRHSVEIRHLKDYLNAEADAKRGMSVDTKDLQGMTAKGIPEQTNFCDCGVYLVGYVEQFAKDPRNFVTKVLSGQLDKRSDFASFDPSAKRAEIRDELLKLNEEQEAARQAKKAEKKSAKAGGDTTKPKDAPAAVAPATTGDSSKVRSKADANTHADAGNPTEETEASLQEIGSINVAPNVDVEDDELETGVPRPFQKYSVPHNETVNTASDEPSSDMAENEEMLDGADIFEGFPDDEAAAVSKGSPIPPYPQVLLDEMDGGASAYQRPNANEPSAAAHESGQGVDIFADNELAMEIQDSQEVKHVPSAPTRWGTHTRFTYED